jgi:hypothetical protein
VISSRTGDFSSFSSATDASFCSMIVTVPKRSTIVFAINKRTLAPKRGITLALQQGFTSYERVPVPGDEKLLDDELLWAIYLCRHGSN